ncbi:MAG: carboxypeptidase-like regulatory domain-containing protein [Bacteroidales bacterium]|nr:carboxypeptidase-like regulatory domain-containing protein [Bacteroidales bacterium]
MKAIRIIIGIILLGISTQLSASTLSGRIVDEKGNGLAYASLYLKNDPQTGSISDINGRFSLEISNKHDSLIVALVGYETVIINLEKINLSKNLKITMKEQAIILHEVVVSVQEKGKNKKKSKKEERAEIKEILAKVYQRIEKDFPTNNVKFSVVSDLTASSGDQVIMFDEWIGDIVEIRDYRGPHDSIQMKMQLDKRYLNSAVRQSLNSYNPDNYTKHERRIVDKVDVNSLKKVKPHLIAWELDIQQLFYRYLSDNKHWSMVEKDGNTIVLTLTLTHKLPGIYNLVQKLVYAIDKNTYSIKTVSERVSAEVNIPFGYKMTSAELALLNAFVLDGDGFEKYRLKGFKGTSCRNNIFTRQDGQLVVSEKNFTASGYIVDNKDQKINFSSKIKTRVLDVQTKNVKPYSAQELKSGKVQELQTPAW